MVIKWWQNHDLGWIIAFKRGRWCNKLEFLSSWASVHFYTETSCYSKCFQHCSKRQWSITSGFVWERRHQKDEICSPTHNFPVLIKGAVQTGPSSCVKNSEGAFIGTWTHWQLLMFTLRCSFCLLIQIQSMF